MSHDLYNFFFNLYLSLRQSFLWAGFEEAGKFLGTHLISGMIPAFFIAGAISIFLDKQRITRLMGAKANPLIAYPVAALSGGILTVCSCGVLPIFTGILQQGAGIGPAFTFLMASPAVNLIALSYTYTLLGSKFMFYRAFLVMFSAIGIGMGMKMIFGETEETADPVNVIIMEEDQDRSDWQLLAFFVMLIAIMVTSTGVFDSTIDQVAAKFGIHGILIPRLLLIGLQILLLSVVCKKWFYRAEIILWFKKSKSLFILIFPKILGGIFLCGVITVAFPLTNYMKFFDTNDVGGNLLASIIGSLMYFGTIVGVTIVSTLKDFGMHPGPAMTLLLSAPAVSLPSVLALIPIAGAKRSAAFLFLVIFFSALSGLIFGSTF